MNAITITDLAASKIIEMINKRGKPTEAIRIGVKTRGCSGLSYTIEYADKISKYDEIIEDKGVKILIDPKAILFLLGTEMDYKQEKFKSGFEFTNPNEKSKCGCGESFNV